MPPPYRLPAAAPAICHLAAEARIRAANNSAAMDTLRVNLERRFLAA
jgi:hypothetical protein